MEQQELIKMIRGYVHDKVEDWNGIPAYLRIAITKRIEIFAHDLQDITISEFVKKQNKLAKTVAKKAWHNDEEDHEDMEEEDTEEAVVESNILPDFPAVPPMPDTPPPIEKKKTRMELFKEAWKNRK